MGDGQAQHGGIICVLQTQFSSLFINFFVVAEKEQKSLKGLNCKYITRKHSNTEVKSIKEAKEQD